ncbi:LptF/LptG family permease [Rhodothermus profundi]|uniref:Lipopolysaccharide export system permease protein n=1 Tax=Rhodothermus profundi TaxID=633813 RepID=A0A1M6TR74_9BACT|nr:LptF/LptG family permease [Rhodothermus profundi]SHK59437.1 lipopolysaccharide export system permease protein [Rhodothermus profundi]
MKHLHRMTLSMLPGPFLGWFGTLMFLLVMQFLIKYLPDLVGKGLPLGIILELISYNLAYMVVLAVPMATLIAMIMTFGRLAESNAYQVIKSAGISLLQLTWPLLIVGALLTGAMMYFNNLILPEANHRARNLWIDIQRKKPGFQLQPGVFYDGIEGYSILVQHRDPETDSLRDITIYDYRYSGEHAVLKARRGLLQPIAGGRFIDLILEDGEFHRLRRLEGQERYERLAFARYRLRLDLSDFVFTRSQEEGYRTDRTTPTPQMLALVDSMEAEVQRNRQRIRQLLLGVLHPTAQRTAAKTPAFQAAADDMLLSRPVLQGLPDTRRSMLYELALQQSRRLQTQIEELQRTVQWTKRRADRYRVEIHKKFSIAVACLIFVLIGMPLGLSVRRGGLGLAGGLALGIFLFYWITLVQGEKLADRGYLAPWLGMWLPNLVMGLIGLVLVTYVSFDLRVTRPLVWLTQKLHALRDAVSRPYAYR